MNNIKIGQKLWSKGLAEYTVSKIGKKYFYVEENRNYRFDSKTLTHSVPGYSQSNFTLFTNKQDLLDEQERCELFNKIKSHLNSSYSPKDSLTKLREIALILGI